MNLLFEIIVVIDTAVLALLFAGIFWVLSRPQISTLIAAVAHMPTSTLNAGPADIAKISTSTIENLNAFTVPDDDQEPKP